MRYKSLSLSETKKIAAEVVKKLSPGIENGLFIGLSGDLGSGKTAFVKGVAKALKIKETVISPTFVLMRRYKIPKTKNSLIHIDAYRLNTKKELKALLPKNTAHTLILIEWPECIPGLSKKILKTILFKHGKKEQERIIIF
jgi:tRNA threonylcarbamoyladenosine biosynthesis protein TsaE